MAHATAATLTVAGLDVSLGARTLVSGLDLTLAPGDVTALVGPNGSGKSTLMRLLVGDLPIEQGSVRLAPPGATLAWLPQTLPARAESLLDYVRRRTGVEAADRRLESAADRLASAEQGAEDDYAEALERWLALGGANLVDRLPEVTARVGLTVPADRPLGSLSGGEAARVSLVAVLLSHYDVLLLDEPTNDLDRRGQRLVVDFVRGHEGPVLVASHDRAFLDEVATGVVELDLHQGRVGHYAGGWSDYAQARDLTRAQEWEAYAGYASARDALVAQSRQRQGWAARGHRAVRSGAEADKHLRERDRARADRQLGKAARVARAVDRLEVVEQPRKEWQLSYAISEGPPSTDVVASLDAAVAARGSFRIGPVSLVLGRGDRVALTGDNGSGKTTLVGALLGSLPLESGRASVGSRVSLGVLDQQRALLDSDDPVLEIVRGALGAHLTEGDDGEVRTLLAKFGLGADHVHRPGRSLSLGERTRALLAVFQGRAVNTLVLDEPTNHLDVAAIQQLEQAVAGFGGTLVVVSHDRRFLQSVGVTSEWHVEAGAVSVAELS
ncbi:ABC-F family ATP-binding cassette domain-containing protein [Nocardioides bigeumensis]|uniref:ABC-F family ATP-binding cassette domain-containing protein n=1 Tax=Nocardioides bigeumensis TaxID=433657 RepID=A0ABP5JAR2_9ACTN